MMKVIPSLIISFAIGCLIFHNARAQPPTYPSEEVLIEIKNALFLVGIGKDQGTAIGVTIIGYGDGRLMASKITVFKKGAEPGIYAVKPNARLAVHGEGHDMYVVLRISSAGANFIGETAIGLQEVSAKEVAINLPFPWTNMKRRAFLAPGVKTIAKSLSDLSQPKK